MDGNGVLGEIYTWSITILDLVTLFIRMLFTVLYSVYQIFVPPEEKSVTGEIILITGTGHGIGKELAKQYGALGAELVCVDLNSATNDETVSELRKSGIKAHGYSCDVSKREQVVELGRKVKMEVGDVSILVNNAGIMPVKRFLDYTPEDLTRIMNINVMAHYWMLEQFLPRMMERNHGHIVALSSIAGLIGFPHVAPYCGSKFAVRGMMESLCEELRQEGRNIGFTTIYPYMVDTGLCKKPRIKFPGLLAIQTPEFTASQIIMAQRRGYREQSVPGFMKHLQNTGRILPEKTQVTLIDFVDSGVEVTD